MKILRVLSLLPALLQVLSELVDIVEDAALPGDQKRAAVIEGFIAIWNGILLEQFPKWTRYPMEAIIRMVGQLIDTLVQLKHAVGLFTAKPREVLTV